MSNKRTSIFVGVGLAIILIALFAWPKINNPNKDLIKSWNDAGVECLEMGHARLAQHFHPHLTILIDGQEAEIPANIGIINNCMAEVHTHDATGTLHVETVEADKVVYLKNFFTVWGRPIEQEGYELTMTVDGVQSNEFGNLILRDKQNIVLQYETGLPAGEK